MVEKDIELIKQVIDTSFYDGVEYFHTYKGVKYYRCFITIAQGGDTGMPTLVYIENGKVKFVEDSYTKRDVFIAKLNYSH